MRAAEAHDQRQPGGQQQRHLQQVEPPTEDLQYLTGRTSHADGTGNSGHRGWILGEEAIDECRGSTCATEQPGNRLQASGHQCAVGEQQERQHQQPDGGPRGHVPEPRHPLTRR